MNPQNFNLHTQMASRFLSITFLIFFILTIYTTHQFPFPFNLALDKTHPYR